MRSTYLTPRPSDTSSRPLNIRAHAHTILTLSIGVGCLLVGGVFLWAWFDPERLAETSPIHLLGLLGLFLLPAATIAFQTIDRRRREEPVNAANTQNSPAPITPTHQDDKLTHSIRRHRAQRRAAPRLRARRTRPIN